MKHQSLTSTFYISSLALAALSLGGCASLGKVMSPYSETFSCKNRDHGQCIDPLEAHADAVAGVPSRSEAAVTRDKTLLGSNAMGGRPVRGKTPPQAGYQDSVYRELQGLIDAPETPMLRQGRTVRTLIMPYADRGRPDRLYMPRYVYSILERAQWVVGDYLVIPPADAGRSQVLRQSRDTGASPIDASAPVPAPLAPQKTPPGAETQPGAGTPLAGEVQP